MKYFLPYLLQISAMLTDILLIIALILIGCYFSWFNAFILFLLVTYANNQVGGWFYAYKRNNIKSFFKNWRDILDKK